ncbi:NERD domain-containing protein [Acetobacter orientalis]|uniref:nuclease-related domain-containing DEAD/DEAH box helicase n=1 Tax=Acetobacter orientalis TaxID=146474 RepID=UPI0039E74851
MMAILWPHELPISIRQDRRRSAEIRVYDRLAAVLDDSFTVFYSSPWLGTDHLGNERDGECDFMIAHPRMGYLTLEVKGGGISFDPTERQWWSTDRDGFRFRIKDPVEQARSAKHALLAKLRATRHWQDRWIHNSHGVVFPDAAVPPRDLGADRPAHIFCCSRELAHGFREWIEARMREVAPKPTSRGLGRDGIAAFESILAQPFTLSFQIAGAMENDRNQFSVLEPTQFHILENIAEIPRVEIRGGAGTGKTIVAIEEARRAAAAGQRTLLTCFGRPLANELARNAGAMENLTIAGFHAVCLRAAEEAGLELPPAARRDQHFFDNVLPGLLVDAVTARPDLKWQNIIIDEGQDFQESWWIAIDAALQPSGSLRVFSDANQRVYARQAVPAADLQMVPIRLSRNLRNTKSIHAAAAVHYEGPEIIAEGPDGLAVNWIEGSTTDGLIKAAYKEVRRLVFQEEVATNEIAVLLPNVDWLGLFQVEASRSQLEFADCGDLSTDRIVVDTLRRFKGLERPATILVVGESDLARGELAYVGLSRPRFYLTVVARVADMGWLRQVIASVRAVPREHDT